jgi:(R,R)-butanediol dehydrogenase/meso-butanediol dehydrogenase/diacetyl reductase
MKQVWHIESEKKGLLDQLEVREVPEPTPGSNEIKVKVEYAALCATDVHSITQGIMGRKPPRSIGHEASGVVVELGPGAEKGDIKVGDKVVFSPRSACGICAMCKKGKPGFCVNGSGGGAFAEYVVRSANVTHKIPDDADCKIYSLVEPLACCIRSMDLAAIEHGETVMLSGAGGIGMILLNTILLSGAAKITVSEPSAAKREIALSMGAQYVIDPFNEDVVERAMSITNGEGFKYVFEASGSTKAALPCTKAISKDGKIMYFAVYPPTFEMPLNLYDLYMHEGSIQTHRGTTTLFPRAIDLMPRMQMEKVIGKIIPLADALEAFELFEESIYAKILLKC